MDYNQMSLKMHEENHGKLEVVSKVAINDRDDLSTAYTPGVAEPCRKIHANPADVYKYTCKANTVAVVSDGTAVLGLGDIGPEAAISGEQWVTLHRWQQEGGILLTVEDGQDFFEVFENFLNGESRPTFFD